MTCHGWSGGTTTSTPAAPQTSYLTSVLDLINALMTKWTCSHSHASKFSLKIFPEDWRWLEQKSRRTTSIKEWKAVHPFSQETRNIIYMNITYCNGVKLVSVVGLIKSIFLVLQIQKGWKKQKLVCQEWGKCISNKNKTNEYCFLQRALYVLVLYVNTCI